jgi:hypothetical protein
LGRTPAQHAGRAEGLGDIAAASMTAPHGRQVRLGDRHGGTDCMKHLGMETTNPKYPGKGKLRPVNSRCGIYDRSPFILNSGCSIAIEHTKTNLSQTQRKNQGGGSWWPRPRAIRSGHRSIFSRTVSDIPVRGGLLECAQRFLVAAHLASAIPRVRAVKQMQPVMLHGLLKRGHRLLGRPSDRWTLLNPNRASALYGLRRSMAS